jgi:hypothetical protein
MFETVAPDGLITEIEASHVGESVLMARRCAAIAALLWWRVREAEGSDPDPGYALVTGFARTTAEVSAAMNLAPMGAHRLVAQAETLDSRLPRIAGLLAAGAVDWRTVAIIIARTELVAEELIGHVDEALVARIGTWQCWSRRRIIHAVDALVQAVDPGAAKERRVRADDERHISVTPLPDGMAKIRGAVSASAGAAFDKRLSAMAVAVCAKDSRTLAQRRADAVIALVEGRALRCDCAQPDCPARDDDSAPTPGPVRTVINVIATEATVAGDSAQPGYLEGYGVIDAEQVRQLAASARLQPLSCPAEGAERALRYQPTAALARWIRCRDVTCRFPGCDRKASFCDLDHTDPFNHANPLAGGFTVPEDLACYCREHHRLKTFYSGPGGWRDEQLADGTIVWTAPTGRTYRTTPDGYELFPQLRPPCRPPEPRPRSRAVEKAARVARARQQLAEQRPVNTETRRINAARRREIDLRRWRNHMRKMLILLKGGRPSTSPWCSWVNDPLEPEELPPDWQPPPPPSTTDEDNPPF